MKNNFVISSLKLIFVAISGIFYSLAVIPVSNSVLPLWATFISSVLFYLACFMAAYVILEEYLDE